MSTPQKQKWKKSGWRSIRHQGLPRLLIRFRPKLGPKIKFLVPEEESAFNAKEIAEGRVPADSLAALLKEAEEHWTRLVKEGA